MTIYKLLHHLSGLCSFFFLNVVFQLLNPFCVSGYGRVIKNKKLCSWQKTSLLLFIVVCIHAKQITLWASVGVFISKITSQHGQSSSSMEINEVAAWCCYKKKQVIQRDFVKATAECDVIHLLLGREFTRTRNVLPELSWALQTRVCSFHNAISSYETAVGLMDGLKTPELYFPRKSKNIGPSCWIVAT